MSEHQRGEVSVMTFLRWLFVLLRLTGETVVLGFTFHHAHWSVAIALTYITAKMEFETFFAGRAKQQEEGSLAERNRMIERLRHLT